MHHTCPQREWSWNCMSSCMLSSQPKASLFVFVGMAMWKSYLDKSRQPFGNQFHEFPTHHHMTSPIFECWLSKGILTQGPSCWWLTWNPAKWLLSGIEDWLIDVSNMSRLYVQVYLYTCIWSNYSDLTQPHPEFWFCKGNPFISGKSRLVNYCSICPDTYGLLTPRTNHW